LCDPSGGPVDALGDVATVRPDFPRDQREEALRVGISLDQRSILSQFGLECGKVVDHSVVGEEPTVLPEGVGVAVYQIPGGGETHVGHEGSG
jgi:hypothetical protein